MTGGENRKNCQVVFSYSDKEFNKEFLIGLYERRLEIIGNIAKRNLLKQSDFTTQTC